MTHGAHAGPLTCCPYCAHVSPPGSKFCNECGAALHLLPCPHCGAVNDVTTMDHCARCGGALVVAERETEPAATVPFAATLPAGDAAEPLMPPAPRLLRRPLPLLLGATALIAIAGMAWYPRREPAPAPPPAPIPAPAPRAMPTTATAPASPPAPIEASAATALAESPAPLVPPDSPTAASLPPPPTPPRPAATPRRPERAMAPSAPRSPAPPPCTEAVAALGLCNNPRSP